MSEIEYCEQCGYIKQQCQCEKPMTNADRIRNMSDEELAEFLETYSICEHCKYDSNHSCTLQNPCVHALAQAIALEWLQAEVEDKP